MRDLRRPHLAAAMMAVGACVLYCLTLLPGLDLGDTASFQVMAGARVITPRDAYPLYFAIGRVFVWLTPWEPAFALNLASAVEGGIAVGLLVLLAYELSGSVIASVAAGLVLAGSYTFWSQSVIAEVYALHLCFVAGTLLLLLQWERNPTTTRLVVFFAVFALGFGNHLSMILLAPAYTIFLFASAPGRWRSIVTPRVLGVALLCAALGALQYSWNLRTLWLQPDAPSGAVEGLKAFWFDVTKSDWRSTMVLQVPSDALFDRLQLYLFDVRQQFGWVGPLLAFAGAMVLIWRSPRRGVLLLVTYLMNVAFAFGYNVGDGYVFFLPSHLVLAALIAPALGALDRVAGHRAVPSAAMVLWGVWAVYDNFPALNRSHDSRPAQLLAALGSNVDEQRSVLLTDLNWQIQNGLDYVAREPRPNLAHARMADVILYLPAFIRDNLTIGRDIVLTEKAKADLSEAYGTMFVPEPDESSRTPSLSNTIQALPPGTRYVLCVLRADPEFPMDRSDLDRSLNLLTGGRLTGLPDSDYGTVVGLLGQHPVKIESGSRPFRVSVDVDNLQVQVRMESWLAFDTIRRMGFGHVVVGLRHALIVERGVSFVALDALGRATQTVYAGGLFEPQRRYVIRAPGVAR
jgi:hypothetical protein